MTFCPDDWARIKEVFEGARVLAVRDRAEADVVPVDDAAGEREKIAVADRVRALVGWHKKVFPPGCAFEPTLSSQGFDHVVGGLRTSAEHAKNLPPRRFAPAMLGER